MNYFESEAKCSGMCAFMPIYTTYDSTKYTKGMEKYLENPEDDSLNEYSCY